MTRPRSTLITLEQLRVDVVVVFVGRKSAHVLDAGLVARDHVGQTAYRVISIIIIIIQRAAAEYVSSSALVLCTSSSSSSQLFADRYSSIALAAGVVFFFLVVKDHSSSFSWLLELVS